MKIDYDLTVRWASSFIFSANEGYTMKLDPTGTFLLAGSANGQIAKL